MVSVFVLAGVIGLQLDGRPVEPGGTGMPFGLLAMRPGGLGVGGHFGLLARDAFMLSRPCLALARPLLARPALGSVVPIVHTCPVPCTDIPNQSVST